MIHLNFNIRSNLDLDIPYYFQPLNFHLPVISAPFNLRFNTKFPNSNPFFALT